MRGITLMKNEILNEFDQNKLLYSQFSTSMESLINTLLCASGITPHSVSSRVKERSSLLKKIEKKDKYTYLAELTDIIGIRAITHYSDDVDRIASIIEQEFTIDIENSIDKRASLDPDRFGYLSLHYVVGLSENRSELIEYRRFEGLKLEIQIRSILQHTWAEIEHDIGYKSKIEIPKPVRRKFSQLAGLLELADDQFIQIRNELSAYEVNVQETIVQAPQHVSIDKVSIYNYVKSSNLLSQIDSQLAEILGVTLIDLTKDNAARHIKYLSYFGIETISQLEESVTKYKEYILRRANDIKAEDDTQSDKASRGLSVFYLHQVLASQIGTEVEILQFLEKMNLCLVEERKDFATYLNKFGEKIV
jgi:putative GTP pyrophosphokinase